MEQLTLPGVDMIAKTVQIPADIFWGGLFYGDWSFCYRPGSTLCTNHPDTSTVLLERSPYQIGTFYEGLVIAKVAVVAIREGWAWQLTLRKETHDDIIGYQRRVRPTARPFVVA